VTTLDDHVADLNERLSAQESHYEGIRAAIFELRRDLLNRSSPREADVVALRQQGEDLRQRVVDLEKLLASGFAEIHRSIQMLVDRRDVTLLQRSVNEAMKHIQALEVGQQELKQDLQTLQANVHDLDARQQELRQNIQELRQNVQELQAGQQELRQNVEELQAGQQELRQNVQELQAGQQRIEQTLQQILLKLH
jgi:chromosome segregation ATPase